MHTLTGHYSMDHRASATSQCVANKTALVLRAEESNAPLAQTGGLRNPAVLKIAYHRARHEHVDRLALARCGWVFKSRDLCTPDADSFEGSQEPLSFAWWRQEGWHTML